MTTMRVWSLWMAVLLFITSCVNAQQCHGWSYDVKNSVAGPLYWSQFCGAGFESCNSESNENLQSPVDIRTKSVSRVSQTSRAVHMDAIAFSAFQLSQLNLTFAENVIRMEIPEDRNLNANVTLSNAFQREQQSKGQRFNYRMRRVLLHTQSEHSVDGKRADLELQFVCELIDQSYKGQVPTIAILSVLFSASASEPIQKSYNTGIAKVIEGLNELQSSANSFTIVNQLSYLVNVIPLGVDDISKPSYYHYIGSQTEPPCHTNVAWYIYRDARLISVEQKETIHNFVQAKLQYTPNSRPVQALMKRRVYLWEYNSAAKSNETAAAWKIGIILAATVLMALVAIAAVVREEVMQFLSEYRSKVTRSNYDTILN